MAEERLPYTDILKLESEQDQIQQLRAYIAYFDALGVNTQVVRKARKRLSGLTKIVIETAPQKPLGKLSSKQGKSAAKLVREQKRSQKGKQKDG